jgi:hypothetical protein
MFALQRSLLYAIPAGLILLISWRKRLLKNEKGLPLWIEWCLYTTMPLFHIHTFIFLSAMLGIWLITGPNRKEILKLIVLSIPIATFLVKLSAGFGNAQFLSAFPGEVVLIGSNGSTGTIDQRTGTHRAARIDETEGV